MESTTVHTKILRLIGEMVKEDSISADGKNLLKCNLFIFIDI